MENKQPIRLQKNEKLKVEDANISDERIPRNLILMYGDQPYIQKAGLEWKANSLFGGAGYSIKTEIIENDRQGKYVLVKATLTVLKNGATYENFGEAHAGNVNSRMLSQLLHLAVTRAECRVLRMATACGYASYEEVATMPGSLHLGLPTPDSIAAKKAKKAEQLKGNAVLVRPDIPPSPEEAGVTQPATSEQKQSELLRNFEEGRK
jgi:hypothetical protein